ncbi:MAG: VWA domain-containing protein [Vicinamibacterales bacterium]
MVPFADRRLPGLVLWLVVAAMVAASASHVPAGAPQSGTAGGVRPAFHAESDAVWMAATVLDEAGRLVTDLTKDDFEVLDNGQSRDVSFFRNDAVPFSIVVMIDMSGSMLGALPLARRAVSELVTTFMPGDRANVGLFAGIPTVAPRFSANLQTILGWVSVDRIAGSCRQWAYRPLLPPEAAGKGGVTALWNAIECGIETAAVDSETPRRVVLVVSDGEDTMGLGPPGGAPQDAAAVLTKLAAQYGIMVYAIGIRGPEPSSSREQLAKLAANTGGGYAQLTNRDDLPEMFARVGEELRHQYIFGFTAGGADVSARTFEVRVRRPGLSTRARRVSVHSAPPVMVATSIPNSPVPTASEESVDAPRLGDAALGAVSFSRLDAYERGEAIEASGLSLAPMDLFAAVQGLRRMAPAWIRAGGTEAVARRTLAVATYALDLVDQNSRVDWPEPITPYDFVEWACSMVRGTPASPAERSWQLASTALLERVTVMPRAGSPIGALQPDVPISLPAKNRFTAHVRHGEERYPEEPLWGLARAIVADALPEFAETRAGQRASRIKGYENVLSRPTVFGTDGQFTSVSLVQQEARVRMALVELVFGNSEAALRLLDQAGTPDDPALRYWYGLFKGRALETAERSADAVAAYRIAFAAYPYAQAATTALGAALVTDHQSTEASALVSRMLLLRPPPSDPWFAYRTPLYRHWPDLRRELRSAIKP